MRLPEGDGTLEKGFHPSSRLSISVHISCRNTQKRHASDAIDNWFICANARVAARVGEIARRWHTHVECVHARVFDMGHTAKCQTNPAPTPPSIPMMLYGPQSVAVVHQWQKRCVCVFCLRVFISTLRSRITFASVR